MPTQYGGVGIAAGLYQWLAISVTNDRQSLGHIDAKPRLAPDASLEQKLAIPEVSEFQFIDKDKALVDELLHDRGMDLKVP